MKKKLTRKELLKSIADDKAVFIEEKHCCKDAWVQTYETNGQKFIIGAFGEERWLDEADGIELI